MNKNQNKSLHSTYFWTLQPGIPYIIWRWMECSTILLAATSCIVGNAGGNFASCCPNARFHVFQRGRCEIKALWLPHMVKYTVCRLACELRQTHKYVVEKGKCWGVEPLDKCKVTIATSAFRCRLLWQQFFVSKTTLSHVCVTEEVELHLLFMTNYLPS